MRVKSAGSGRLSPSPGGPRSAERSFLLGKLTRGGLGKPLGRGEGEHPSIPLIKIRIIGMFSTGQNEVLTRHGPGRPRIAKAFGVPPSGGPDRVNAEL
jgi:hypothetical protein